MSSVANVTDSSFEQEVLKAEVPVLVDFGHPGAALVKQLHLWLKTCLKNTPDA
jgi:thioredoxin